MNMICRNDLEYGHNLSPGNTVWDNPNDFTTLKTARSKRCKNCNETIVFKSVVIEFKRWKIPLTIIEENIYGEGGRIPRAAHYLCEECGDLYFNLADRGFAFDYSRTNETFNSFKKIEQERLTEIRRANLITRICL